MCDIFVPKIICILLGKMNQIYIIHIYIVPTTCKPNNIYLKINTQQQLPYHNMATPNIEAYLHKQTQLYQHVLRSTAELKQTIKHQNTIKQNQTIPKQHLPRPLKTFRTTPLNETFSKQYRELFFQHLDKILIHNETGLELQQTKLTNIITDTERQLSMSTESTDKIRQYYHQFLTINNITDHEALPTLKARLTTPKTTPIASTTSTNTDKVHTCNSTQHNVPAPPNTNDQGPTQAQPEPLSTREQPDQQNTQPSEPTAQRKRKQNETHPAATKQLKLHHFLGQSSLHNLANT